MQVEAQFDKEVYFPGDMAHVRLLLTGPYHGRSRGIRCEIVSGENVGVTYHTGSGNNRRKHTAWSRIIYSRAFHTLAVPPTDAVQTVELSYQIPAFPTDHINEHQFTVYHQAKVTLDIGMGSDENYYFHIPVASLPPMEMIPQPVELQSENFRASISSSSGYTGDEISLQVVATKEKKYRSIRVEIEQQVGKFVRRHRSKRDYKHVLQRFEPKGFLQSTFQIPRLPYSTIAGEAFEILTYLKVVIDVAMGRDENIVFEFPYFKSPRHLHGEAPSYEQTEIKGMEVVFCTSCGRENEPGAGFCGKCGTKLVYEE